MTDGRPASLYLNRELSWLAFNARVLQQALDTRVPLLERIKFLSIFSANLDEFYMVRVAGLRRQVAAGVVLTPADGLTPQETLDAIDAEVSRLNAMQRGCLTTLLDEAARHDIRLLGVRDLTAAEWGEIDEYFESQIFPVLTPLAVDPGHPFPYISNLSLSLAVEIRDPDTGAIRFARVKVPKSLPRWIPVRARPNHFVPLEQVIGANLGALFSGMEVVASYVFRITRYSDLDIPVEEPEDLLATIEEQVFQRRFGEVVRVEVQDDMPAHLRALLLEELREDDVTESGRLSERDIVDAGRLLDLSDLTGLATLDLPSLRDAPFVAATPAELRDAERSIFDVIREGDLLVHHPFDSFGASVERLLKEAARDDQVLAIKVTLYRTSGDTAVVAALVEAAQRGKQVAVIVELKARFDEANNITWARQLEDAGVHVAFGSATLKTHAKTALVVRREVDGIRRYIHLGTGNYNSRTARLYTDVGLLTCSPSIGRRRERSVQFAHRLFAAAAVQKAARRAGEHARAFPRADRSRGGARGRRTSGAHRRQDERAGGRRDDRGVVSRVAGGRRDRPDRARDLLPPARTSRRERQHSRHQHRRAFPRALAPVAVQPTAARTSSTSARPTGCRATSTVASRPSRRSKPPRCTSGCARSSARISTTTAWRGTSGPMARGPSATRRARRDRRTRC